MVTAVLGGPVVELSNDDLFEAFNGGRVEGYSESSLKAELGGTEARRLVKRCIEDERLRQFLVVFPEHIDDGSLRDELMALILSEPGVWLADERSNPMDKGPWMQANHFANNGLREAFFLNENAPEIAGIREALLKRSTRLKISSLFRRVTRLDPDQRTHGSSEMDAVVEDLHQILEGREASSPANRKNAQISSKIVSGEQRKVPHEGMRGSVWISVAAAMFLAVARFFAFRRKAG